MDAGKNIVEAVPSAAAWGRGAAAVQRLRSGFMAPGAVIVPGASKDPDLDIAQLQGSQQVRENSFSGRVDFRLNNNWAVYARGFHDQGTNDEPQGVTGRR